MTKAWLIGGAAFLVLLAAAALLSALTAREATLEEGTPEATVQRLLRALDEENHRGAYDLLSEDLKGDCTFQDFVSGREASMRRPRNDRISLVRTRVEGGDAYVTVRVTSVDRGGLLGGYESSYEQGFNLAMEGGEWLFSNYPWPLGECGPWKGLGRPSSLYD